MRPAVAKRHLGRWHAATELGGIPMDVAIGFAMGFGRCGRWEKAESAGKIWQNHRTADLVFGWLLHVIICYYMLLSHRFISGITLGSVIATIGWLECHLFYGESRLASAAKALPVALPPLGIPRHQCNTFWTFQVVPDGSEPIRWSSDGHLMVTITVGHYENHGRRTGVSKCLKMNESVSSCTMKISLMVCLKQLGI